MRRVRYTTRALRDLAALRRYISRDSMRAADRVFFDLMAACEGLGHFPLRGRNGRRRGLRELTTVWPYVIEYRYAALTGVEIARIWHGAQRR